MRRSYLSLLMLSLFANNVLADFEILPNLKTGFIVQDVKPDNQVTRSIESLTIDPGLTVTYESADFKGNWNMSHLHLIRSNEDENFKDDFNTYGYSAEVSIVDNLLTLQVNGGLDLLNLDPGDFLVSDRLFNQDSLSKTRANSALLSLSSSRMSYINVDASLNASAVDTEENASSSANLGGDTLTASSTFTQGDAFDSVFFTLRSEYSQTKSEASELNNQQRADQKSRNIDGFINHRLIGDIGVVLRGSEEAYKFDSVVNSDSSRNFISYGAGLSYAPSPNRYFSLTVNRGERDEEDETYIGGNIRWAFSGRTNVSAEFGRRYYGDSGSFNFNYNTKNLRAAVRYSEQVTNFSRLTANAESLGLFVCPPNSIEISDCYQPGSLNPTLEPGESFVEFTDTVVEISDEPILIKSTNAVLGYSRTRFSTSLEFRYSNPFYEDSGREQLTYTTNLTTNYKLGSKTSLSSKLTYTEVSERPGTTGLGRSFDDTIIRVSGTVTYKINQNLSAKTEFRVVDRDSNLISRNVRDRRLAVELEYTF